MNSVSKISAVILAGGKSERMNKPKPFLYFDNEKIFLAKIAEEYISAGVKNICLVINDEYCRGKWRKKLEPAKPFISVIEKTNPDFGRFHSLKLGVKHFLASDFMFIQNADNPFVNKKIIEHLIKNKNPSGSTVVIHNGKAGHPVLISKKIIDRIHNTDGKEFNLRHILAEFPKLEVEVSDEKIFANINTQNDYEKYFAEN